MTNFLDGIELEPNTLTTPAVPGGAAPFARNARHSKENPNWQTPVEDVECARVALGGAIGFDPWSCVSGNARVRAGEYRGPDHPDVDKRDGSGPAWPTVDSLYANHPGLTTKRSWLKLCAEFAVQRFRRAVWMGFSIEQLCVLAGDPEDQRTCTERWAAGVWYPTDFSVAYIRQRIHFIDPAKPDRPSRPGHANYTLGIGTGPSDFEYAYRHRARIVHGSWTRRQFPNFAFDL